MLVRIFICTVAATFYVGTSVRGREVARERPADVATRAVQFLRTDVLAYESASARTPRRRLFSTLRAAPTQALRLGVPVEREIQGGEVQRYEINLTAGQFLHVVAEQRGVDVVLALTDRDGRRLLEADRPNGSVGPEELFWVADSTETYRVEVSSLEASAPAGKYMLRVAELRQGTGQDQKKLAAQEAFARGMRLRGEANPALAREALKSLSDALDLWSETNEPGSAGYAALLLGDAYRGSGDFPKSLDYYQRALPLEREARDRKGEASTLDNIGGVYSRVGEFRKALDYYEQAGSLYRRLGDREGEAVVVNNVGVIYQGRGQDREALAYFEKASIVFRELGSSGNEAVVLDNIGESYNHLKEHQKALDTYRKALAMHRAAGDRYREAFALNGIGSVYSDSYESAKALEYYRQALELRDRIGDRAGAAVTLFNIGGTYWDLREYQKSLDHTLRAVENFKSLGDRYGQAKALYHAGWVCFSTTQFAKAVEYLRQALEVERALELRADEVKTLDTLARAYANSGDYRKALESVQQKLDLIKDTDDRAGVAEATSNIGILYSEMGEPQNALEFLQRALRLYEEAGDKRGQAVTLNGLGWLSYTQGEKQKAAERFQGALAISKELRDVYQQAKVLYNLAELKSSEGAWGQAVKFLSESLDLEESRLAVNLLSGAEWERKYFLKEYIRSLQLAISINVRYAPADPAAARLALTTLLRRKGRILDSMAEEHAALRRNADAETLALLDQLNRYVSEQSQLKLQGTGDASLREYQSRMNETQEKIEEVQLKLNASSYKFRMESKRVSLEEVQQSIPSDAALIEFTVWAPFDQASQKVNKFGSARYLAYVLLDRGDPSVFDLGDAGAVNRLAGRLRGLLREPAVEVGEVRKAARQLYDLIMRPLRQNLGGRTRLLISPDSQLNLIPFAALVDERGDYLVEKYVISYLASGRDLMRLRNPPPPHAPPLIIANPDFEDTSGGGVKGAPSGDKTRGASLIRKKWDALPGTEAEARAIKVLIPSALLKVGGEATEAEMKRADAPFILHLATHGFFLAKEQDDKQPASGAQASSGGPAGELYDGENPMLRSGLVLAGANQKRSGEDDGLLTAVEMASLNLLGTKLVVLSACETGVGQVEVGEGVYGLRRAISLAGAESQVMSLWKVDDAITARLMVEYYTDLLKRGEGRADALRRVQLSMLRGKETGHPYFWAAFIESGAWTGISDAVTPRTKAGR